MKKTENPNVTDVTNVTANPYPVFRPLNADEVEVRIGKIRRDGLTLLLYKDQRADVRILNETVGPANWQNTYPPEFGGKVCVLEIWDPIKNCWIKKSNFGSENQFEPEKSLASDSFKRACFNWAIGSELYSLKDIFVDAKWCNITCDTKQRLVCYDEFKVEYFICNEHKKIIALTIINETTGKRVFVYDKRPEKTPETEKPANEKKADEKKEQKTQAPAPEEKPVVSVTPNPKQEEVNDIPQTIKKSDGVPLSLPEGVKPEYSVDLDKAGDNEPVSDEEMLTEFELAVNEAETLEKPANEEADETETLKDEPAEEDAAEQEESVNEQEITEVEAAGDSVNEDTVSVYTEAEWQAFLEMEIPFGKAELRGKKVSDVLDEAVNNAASAERKAFVWAVSRYDADPVFQKGCAEAVRRYGW